MGDRSEPPVGLAIGAGALAVGFAGLALATDGFGLTFPTLGLSRGHFVFLALYVVVGLLVWPHAARLAERLGVERRAVAWLDRGSDAHWMLGGAVATVVVAVALRVLVLRQLPITDDEYAYLFSARLLASGRLSVPSPPYPTFFDHMFLSGDGRTFSQYFLGWPALLVPAVWAGVPGFANAAYAGLTAPANLLVARRLAGSRWARASLGLYLTSPALMYAAATGLSHTTCIALLAWCTWSVLRSEDPDAPWWIDALVGATFAAAFFVRPQSTVGAGVPLLIAWGIGWWRRPHGRAGPLVAFAVPAGVLAVLFLAADRALTGHALLTPYVAVDRYINAHYRTPADPWFSVSPVNLAKVHSALWMRLGVGLFGWPVSLVFIGRARGVPMLWAMVLGYYVCLSVVEDPGVEIIPPPHFLELSLPLWWLTVRGASASTEAPLGLGRVGTTLASGVGLAVFVFHPVMFGAIRRSQDVVAAPFDAVAALPPGSVAFLAQPVACDDAVSWVLWRPLSDPDLTDPVVWVNHLDVPRDRRLMREVFPDRHGYVVIVDAGCHGQRYDLDAPGLAVPDGAWLGWALSPP